MKQRIALIGKRLFLATLIFALVSSLYVFNSKPAEAANFQTKSGYYMGTGVSGLTVSGMGFQPNLVMIKSANTAQMMRFKTSSMAANVTGVMGGATAFDTTTQITLTSTGFSVGTLADVNAANVLYRWVAFGGSDCSATGNFCVGSWTGNATNPRTITTGFQPSIVITKSSNNLTAANFRTASMPTDRTEYFSSTAANTSGAFIQSFTSTGFAIGASNNTTLVGYHYIAFGTTGGVKEGTYTGNATAGRSITGVGFKPSSVFVKNSSAGTANNRRVLFEATSHQSALSSYVGDAVVDVSTGITELQSDGFQLGTLANANENSATFYYLAFGPEPTPTTSGTFSYTSGTYTGTGSAFSVTSVGFQPDLVIIKGSGTEIAMARLSVIPGDSTSFLGSSSANTTGAVTALTSTGFSVGTNANVNTNGSSYSWQAFGNAYNPLTQSGATDFAIGMYYGSSTDNRNIMGLPFTPDFVLTKSNGASAAQIRTSSHPTDSSSYLSATADSANNIQAFNTDGFQVGSSSVVNSNAIFVGYIAFKNGTNFAVGSYTGNGANGRTVSTGSITPNLAWVKQSGAVAGVFRSSVWGGSTSRYFINTAPASNMITAFPTGGFTIDSNATVNTNAATYYYAVWQPAYVSSLTVSIVDDTGSPIASPSYSLSAAQMSFSCTTSTGSLGSFSSRFRVDNQSFDLWSLSVAPTGGTTSTWSNAGATRKYDVNEPSGCTDSGGDTDAFGGALSLNSDYTVIEGLNGCTNNDINVPGAVQTLSEGSVNALVIATSGASADVFCQFDIYDVLIEQSIPSETQADSYTLPLTATVVAI